MKNLKAVLMELGNILVSERGWLPATTQETQEKTTKPILDFTKFLNDNEEAAAVLASLGLEWPSVNKPGPSSTVQDDDFKSEVLNPRTCSIGDEGCTSCE